MAIKTTHHVLVQVINILLLLLSIVLFFLGILAYDSIRLYDKILTNSDHQSPLRYRYDPSVWIITTGVLLYVAFAVGFVGAFKENKILLKVYIGILIVLCSLGVIAMVWCVLYDNEMDNIKKEFKHSKEKTFKKGTVQYRDNIDLKKFVDSLQQVYTCCGWFSYKDWDDNRYYKCGGPSPAECGVPHSCCIQKTTNIQCGWRVRNRHLRTKTSKIIYADGCANKLPDFTLRGVLSDGNILKIDVFKFNSIRYICLVQIFFSFLAMLGSVLLIRYINKEIAAFEQSRQNETGRVNQDVCLPTHDKQEIGQSEMGRVNKANYAPSYSEQLTQQYFVAVI